MSMYGESEYACEKNNMYEYMVCFLKDHPLSELIEILSNAAGYKENKDKGFRLYGYMMYDPDYPHK